MKMAALAVHHRQDVLQEIRRAAGPCARRRTTRKPSHGAVRPLNRDTPSLWFRKAADQGGVDGQSAPAKFLKWASACRRTTEAYVWFKLAASPRKTTQIRDVISNKLDVLGTNITPAQTAEAQSTHGLDRESDPRKRVSGVFVDGRSLAFSTPLGLAFVFTWPPI